MNLATAQRYADKLVEWIHPFCERIEIAGSIRRERSVCNDVDIVCIPRITEDRDLLNAVTGRQNHVLQFLQNYVAQSAGKARFLSGGDREGKLIHMELPKCQLDLWFATPETFATRLLCRTGSKEHNVWLCGVARAHHMKWNPYEGLLDGGYWSGEEYNDGSVVAAATEDEIYRTLNVEPIRPQYREEFWIARNRK